MRLKNDSKSYSKLINSTQLFVTGTFNMPILETGFL